MKRSERNGKNGKDVDLVVTTLKNTYGAKHTRAKIKAYRYNPVSIRVRIVDPDFTGKDRVDRYDEVLPIFEQLPDEVRSDVMLVLLLTPKECKESEGNYEFEHPSPAE